MNKIKFLSIICIGLLLANLALISYLIIMKPNNGSKRNEGPRNEIIARLAFNAEQVIAYDKLIKVHRKSIRQADEQISDLKNELYNNLNDSNVAITNDSIISQIGNVQMQIEQIHYKHFEAIKEICVGNEQRKKFELLTSEMADLFNKKHPKP